MKDTQVHRIVDAICNRGCRYVNTVLHDSENVAQCQELLALKSGDRHLVVEELKSVMSVYEQTGNCKI